MVPKRILTVLAAAALALLPNVARAQHLLVPMDDEQTNHLKAYGLTYNALKDGARGEWLLNYRGGSFLLPDTPELRRRAALDGITTQPVDDATLSDIRNQMSQANMESVPLEKAPRIAVYTAPYSPPWDDAVILALRYAGIPYTPIWDEEIEHGDLAKYDWVHLFHEDFTGQLGKFYITYSGASWFVDMQRTNLAMAKKLGFPNIPALKKDVAMKIRDYVNNGGFLFAMCGATETLDLALAAHDVDIASVFADGTPMDPNADAKMDWNASLAFRGAQLEMSPYVNSMSDIDGHQANVPGRRQPLGTFTLFAFSAKFDPVPSMLVQDHRTVIPDFYGVTTSFMKNRIKPGVTILADEPGAPWAKYIHGDYGKGSWTFLGGHDPEDPQHAIGNPPTDLSLHPNSPGYRLILNNVLFPAAKKKPLKT